MLLYRIQKHKGQRKALGDKDSILAKHLGRTHFQVGDDVRFRKPKKGAKKGNVVYIDDDCDTVTWRDNTPLNIHLVMEDGARLKTYVDVLTPIRKRK